MFTIQVTMVFKPGLCTVVQVTHFSRLVNPDYKLLLWVVLEPEDDLYLYSVLISLPLASLHIALCHC